MKSDAGPMAPARLLALTFVVGAVLGLLGVVLWVNVGDDEGEDATLQASSRSVADEPDPEPREDDASAPPQQPADTRASRCSEAATALEAPLRAAGPALRQWDVHVDAMNQLVVGEITLQQATTFWNQTRVGAQRNVDRFQKAWTALERTGVDCPAPGLLGPAPAAVSSCSRLVAAELGVARTARTSIDTWDTHVQHMDMLRMGVLSPEKATEMWLSMWRRGMRDLDAYRAAARDPALDVECPDPDSAG
ncbi:MAG TPA: hypothetical protein VEW73_06310 [Nocardioides sp.]|nr:hypothetical protein [Nocardioides sp.]